MPRPPAARRQGRPPPTASTIRTPPTTTSTATTSAWCRIPNWCRPPSTRRTEMGDGIRPMGGLGGAGAGDRRNGARRNASRLSATRPADARPARPVWSSSASAPTTVCCATPRATSGAAEEGARPARRGAAEAAKRRDCLRRQWPCARWRQTRARAPLAPNRGSGGNAQHLMQPPTQSERGAPRRSPPSCARDRLRRAPAADPRAVCFWRLRARGADSTGGRLRRPPRRLRPTTAATTVHIAARRARRRGAPPPRAARLARRRPRYSAALGAALNVNVSRGRALLLRARAGARTCARISDRESGR